MVRCAGYGRSSTIFPPSQTWDLIDTIGRAFSAMNEAIPLPLWLLIVAGGLGAMGLYLGVIAPAWRWVWERRSQRVVDQVNPHLQLKLSPFTLTPRRVLADRLANDPVVLETVEREAATQDATPAQLKKHAHKIAYGIVPSFNPFFYFRIGFWLARGALRALYSVRVGFADRAGLEKVSGDASVVFFVSHRSNVDYMLVTYLAAEKSMLSFGVGEWSHIWPIQPLMRAAGGYFLHRDADDPVYRRILERYVQMATEARVPHAMFPEGALSPDGRLQAPKLGLLSYITRRYDPAVSPDIVFIPIGTNYDRVPEDTKLVRHDPAEFRTKGRGFVYRSGASISIRVFWETLRRRRFYGNACAQFGTPVSFRTWLREHWVDWSALDRDAQHRWLSRFGDELMADVSQLVPVPPVALLCAVLSEYDAEKFSAAGLRQAFTAQARLVRERNGYVTFSADKSEQACDEAVNLLCRRKVLRRLDADQLAVIPSQSAIIDFYANSIGQFTGGKTDAVPSGRPIVKS